MTSYIHGSSDAREVERLEKQAEFVWPFVSPHFHVARGERVLDLATGVGAMAGQILAHHPGVRLVGVDLNPAQLAHARRNHPELPVALGNGTVLPFRTNTFDRVHCSWLLEHVPTPVDILREVHRVLRPGGTCHFIEVDNSTFAVSPSDPDVDWAIDTLNRTQQEAGGDPFVGKKLGAYFRDAGFDDVKLSPSRIDASASAPGLFRKATEEFAEIFEGMDEALGATHVPRLIRAAQHLRKLPQLPGAWLRYEGVIAVAQK